MFFQNYKEQALDDLDSAHKEYGKAAKATSNILEELDGAKVDTLTLIADVEDFVESIRRGPFEFKKELNVIKKQKEKFQKSAEIKKKDRQEKLAGGTAAMAVLGAGAFAVISFWDYIDAALGSKLKKVFGKNILVSLVVGVLAVLFFAILLIGWTISNHRAGKKAEKLTLQIKAETAEMQNASIAAQAVLNLIQKQYGLVGVRLDMLSSLRGMSRKQLSDEQYSDVTALVHDTVGLSELLNK